MLDNGDRIGMASSTVAFLTLTSGISARIVVYRGVCSRGPAVRASSLSYPVVFDSWLIKTILTLDKFRIWEKFLALQLNFFLGQVKNSTEVNVFSQLSTSRR